MTTCIPTMPHECAKTYYAEMARRRRLVSVVANGNRLAGVCTFYILPNVESARKYHERRMWSTPQDIDDGSCAYIDKLWLTTGVAWTRALRQMVTRAITRQHPSIKWAVWYRPSQDADRRYTCKVRV